MYNTPAPDPSRWQNARNESWPPGTTARQIHDRPDPIAVEVRVDFERDGAEWLPGKATRWTRHHVFVKFSDPRWLTQGIWVAPDDVRRLP